MFATIYIPCPNRELAKDLARHLLKKKLIGCANIFECESLYEWQGKLCDEHEHILLCKTLKENAGAIAREVEMVHPYDLPCTETIPAEFSKKYASWLTSVCRSGATTRKKAPERRRTV
jgi:periplasmic divalent cation tolerance protein